MLFFKKKKRVKYTEKLIGFCERTDCYRFAHFLVIENNENPHVSCMWEKTEYSLNSVAGPVPCIFCKYFNGVDFYAKREILPNEAKK